MIEQTSFLGLPLRTQGQRRLLVVLYYALLLAFAVLALWKTRGSVQYLLPQTLTLGGLLGGIKFGGPVKVYSEPKLPLVQIDGVQTLNLAGRKPFDTTLPQNWSPLDEREQARRDHAHYEAYKTLRWTLAAGAVLYGAALYWKSDWLLHKSPILLWLLFIYVLSLPQSVLLWTEPSAPVGELIPMRRP